MAKCPTDCIEKPLRICFEIIGHFIGTHPWWFFVAPFILSAALGSGFCFLKDNVSNDIEKQFTPLDGQAKMERRFIQENFPQDDSMFSSLSLSTDGTYASFIATYRGNILTAEPLQEILLLDRKVQNMTVRDEDEQFKYEDICSTVNGNCSSNAILDIIGYKANSISLYNLTFPIHNSTIDRVSLHFTLGSVKMGNNSLVQSAGAIQLFYYLREKDNKTRADTWLKGFIELISSEYTRTTVTQVSYSTSMSMQWEFEKITPTLILPFSITYTIAISFSIISCFRLDNVRNKVWVATIGVLSTGLAVLSSFGMLLLLEQTFVITVATTPFMIMGIGMDDMFIMISSWQKTNVLDKVPDRLADTYRDAAISISITTLTDVLALFLGFSSPFGSVQAFCLYAGTAVTFCYFYNITLLGAFLVLNGQREASNRHWFTCAKVPEDIPPGKSKGYGICCVGGAYDHDTGTEKEQPVSCFFRKYYGPFLTLKWTKAAVVVLYAGYLAVSIYWCSELKEGIDLRNLALDDSYIKNYYNDQRKHFSLYGPAVMVAVKNPVPYWEEDEQNNLSLCIEQLERLTFVNSSYSWFHTFQSYVNTTIDSDIQSEKDFISNLLPFLEKYPMLRQDINLSNENKIQSSRFFLQTVNITSEKDMLIDLRKTAKQCPTELLVYHPTFIYYDQYTVIQSNTIQTIVVATVAMLAISFILIPNPLCSLWVAFAIVSVIVGVAGFMTLWGVNLDSISMINLVICIGFSVDFSAHVSYAFVSSTKADVNEKAVDALALLGYPIVQGAVSTILGVVVLSTSGCYIFRTFFKIMFLVITLGLVHGIVFLPVFLTFLGTCSK